MPIDLGLDPDAVIEVDPPALPEITAAPPSTSEVEVVPVMGPPGPMTEGDVLALIEENSGDVQALIDASLDETVGDLADLDTADKSSVVHALNEVAANAAAETGIDDDTTGTTTTWSSSKIATQVATKPSIDDDAISTSAVWSSDKTNEEIGSQVADAIADYAAGADAAGQVTLVVEAATDLSGHRVVAPLADGSVGYASNDDLDFVSAPLWLTTGAALAGFTVTVRALGPVDEPSWSWAPGPLYLGADGQLTQATPAAPDAVFLAQVGYATGPTTAFIDRQPSFVLA